MAQARHFKPLALRIDHAPPGEVVQRGAPEHSLLAAGIHGDVAANAGRFQRGGIDRKDQTRGISRFGHALGDNTGFRKDRGDFTVHIGQYLAHDGAQTNQLFGVDDCRQRGQRDGAAGIPGAAAPRNDGQAQLDAARHQRGHFGFGVGVEHHERVFDAPVGRIGDMRDPRHAIEADVVGGGDARQPAQRTGTQGGGLRKRALKPLDGGMRQFEQAPHACRTSARCVRVCERGLGCCGRLAIAATLDFTQTVLQRLDQRSTAAGVVEQVVLQERIALHDPDIAQHFIEHAGRAASAPFGAQFLDDVPGFCAQHTTHDLPVGERGVVVGNFPQPGRRVSGLAGQDQWDRRIHQGIVSAHPVPRRAARA